MLRTPITSLRDPAGPLYSLALSPSCTITFAPKPVVDRIAHESGHVHETTHYTFSLRDTAEKRSVFIANSAAPSPADIDRDDGWRRRTELASALPALINGARDVDPVAVRRSVPIALLVPSYLEAFPEGADAAAVFETAWRNTQQRIEAHVARLMAGAFTYDVDGYASRGVSDPRYSHVLHFAWIYAQQIASIRALMERYPLSTIVIADLGTGCGHFLVTLARHLAAEGLIGRARLIGIDSTDAGLGHARKALADVPEMRAEFVVDDLQSDGFADRLRRLHPDVVVANHVVEHLAGDIKNRYLQDWILAARRIVSISVPLEDHPEQSLSEHVAWYSADAVAELASSMAIRTGGTIAADEIDGTKRGGLCTWMRKDQVADWGGFSCTTVALEPTPASPAMDPILRDFAAPFDPAEFAVARRAPKIGQIGDWRTFARVGAPQQVRQLLIKLPSGHVHLPAELAKFSEAVQIILDHNAAANVDYQRSYAYLNVFQGTTLTSAYRGLSLNCHGDQLQTLHAGYGFNPDWSYIVSSTLPTMLYEQAFDVTEAARKFREGQAINIYDDFNRQASERNLYRTDNFGIYLLSPYVVHAAALATTSIERVFLKVAFSSKRFFDNRELRRNPAFDISGWYDEDTVGYIDGWFGHAHWNERFLKKDLCPDWSH
jgi:hypothetical protein